MIFVHVVPASVLIYARDVAPAGSDRKNIDPIGAVIDPLGSPAPASTNSPPGRLNPRPAVVTLKPFAAVAFIPVGVLSTNVEPAVVEPTLVA